VPSSFFVHDMPPSTTASFIFCTRLSVTRWYSTRRHGGHVLSRPVLIGGITCNLVCCRFVTPPFSGDIRSYVVHGASMADTRAGVAICMIS
jgi:hypothetical protein